MPPSCTGRKGQGVALIVCKTIANYFTFLDTSPTTHTIYAYCEPHLFGKEQPVIFAVTYIAPEQSEERLNLASQYLHLGQELQHYLSSFSPNLIVLGDFNTHIGNQDEITDAHFDLFNTCPSLLSTRRVQCLNIN